MEQKPIFNLYLTYEDALEKAKEFQSAHKADNGKELHIWEDPRGFYNERLKFRLDGIDRKYWNDLTEEYEFGEIEIEAKAALLWLIDRHKGFNCLEINQIIVGVMNFGCGGDREVAIFTYLSREDDILRDFITEKAFELTNN